jgi:hypothetical protein
VSALSETDFRPTDQQVAVHRLFTEQIAALRARFDRFSSDDISRFNELLIQRGRPALALVAKD